MDITRRFVGRTAMLDLGGRLTIGPAEAELAPLRAAIRELTGSGWLDIAINLASVTYLDTRGLGELVCVSATVRRLGGRFALVAPSVPVARMLAVTRLDRVFEVCDSDSELRERSERSNWALSYPAAAPPPAFRPTRDPSRL